MRGGGDLRTMVPVHHSAKHLRCALLWRVRISLFMRPRAIGLLGFMQTGVTRARGACTARQVRLGARLWQPIKQASSVIVQSLFYVRFAAEIQKLLKKKGATLGSFPRFSPTLVSGPTPIGHKGGAGLILTSLSSSRHRRNRRPAPVCWVVFFSVAEQGMKRLKHPYYQRLFIK